MISVLLVASLDEPSRSCLLIADYYFLKVRFIGIVWDVQLEHKLRKIWLDWRYGWDIPGLLKDVKASMVKNLGSSTIHMILTKDLNYSAYKVLPKKGAHRKIDTEIV